VIGARVGAPMFVGLMIGILFIDLPDDDVGLENTIQLLFFGSLMQLLLIVLPTLVVVLPEMPVVQKEYRNDCYGARAYYAAKATVETPLQVFPPLVFLLILCPITGLANDADGNFDASTFALLYVAFLFINILAAALANCVAILAPNIDIALTLLPVCLIPLITTSGVLISVGELTWVYRWFSYINFLAYVWELACYGAFHKKVYTVKGEPFTGEQVLTERLSFLWIDPDAESMWKLVLVLCFFIVLLHGVSSAAVRHKLAQV